MAVKQPKSAKCLCGAVSIQFNTHNNHVEVCHCSMCRKWGGGPFLGKDAGTDIEITGQEFITRYASSDWAERGFCKKCGTHLFYRFKEADQHILPAGLVKESDDFTLHCQIFIDEKPAYYSFSQQTETLTGQQVFEKYAPDT